MKLNHEKCHNLFFGHKHQSKVLDKGKSEKVRKKNCKMQKYIVV